MAFTKLDYAGSLRISDRLLARGDREAVAASSARAAALMAWNYLDIARVEDSKAVLAVAPEGPAVDAVRYRSWLTYNVVPGERPVAPERTDGPFDAAILITDYLMGRLNDLPESSGSDWAHGVATPWRIAMLRARGQTQRALDLYEQTIRARWVPHSRMLTIFIGPELLVDAGRRDEARAAIVRGRRLAQEDGTLSPLALNSFAEAKLALRLDPAGDAAAFLQRIPGRHAPVESKELRRRLVERQILAGVPFLRRPEYDHTLLLAFTEQNTRAEIDQLVDALAEVSA